MGEDMPQIGTPTPVAGGEKGVPNRQQLPRLLCLGREGFPIRWLWPLGGRLPFPTFFLL